MLLPESMLLGAPQFAAPKIDDPEAIAAAGKKRIEGLVKSSKGNANGTPRVIVLCLSGLRCADVVRDLRSIKGKGEVAKVSYFKLNLGQSADKTALRKTHESTRTGQLPTHDKSLNRSRYTSQNRQIDHGR